MNGGGFVREQSAPVVYVISDAAGDTGEAVVKAAAAQFDSKGIEIRRAPFVTCQNDIDRVMKEVLNNCAIIVFTLVIPHLREYLIKQAIHFRIEYVDLLSPVIDRLEQRLGQSSRHQPGIIHQMDEDYFKRIEAVEFAVKYDDARDSSGILKADIVLVGVSRTSKTPLSMYLAHKKYKVANVPLVPEIKPPKELFIIPGQKIIGLKISPSKLNEIRKERLKSLGLSSSASYANKDRIQRELDYAAELMKQLGCFTIDVSNKAVEETAGTILERLV